MGFGMVFGMVFGMDLHGFWGGARSAEKFMPRQNLTKTLVFGWVRGAEISVPNSHKIRAKFMPKSMPNPRKNDPISEPAISCFL